MKTTTVADQYRNGGSTTMIVDLNLPGKIVNVEENKITLQIPVVDGPTLMTEEGRRVLIDGLSDIEADVLLERIAHFAVTESLRSHISFKNITTRTIANERL